MARKDFVPEDQNNLATWATTLETEAVELANAVGMGWDTVVSGEVATAAGKVKDAVAAKAVAQQDWMAVNAAQDVIIADAIATIRLRVGQGKKETTATEAIQQALGVIGEEIEFNPETYVPVLRSVRALGGGNVQVKFSLANGELVAVNLYERRAGELSFKRAATMLRSPFIHHIALAAPDMPETWELCARGVIDNTEIGGPSDPKVVIVS